MKTLMILVATICLTACVTNTPKEIETFDEPLKEEKTVTPTELGTISKAKEPDIALVQKIKESNPDHQPSVKTFSHTGGILKIKIVKGSIKLTDKAWSKQIKQAEQNCEPMNAIPVKDEWRDKGVNRKKLVTSKKRSLTLEYKCL